MESNWLALDFRDLKVDLFLAIDVSVTKNRGCIPFTRTDVPRSEYGSEPLGARTTPFTPRVRLVPKIVAIDPGAIPVAKLAAFTVAD